MVTLVWDQIGSRTYENGIDRGVLYLPDGTAVPWNGLTAVIEKFDKDVSPVYFDGMKVADVAVLGDFSATMKAVTYPDEFNELEGIATLRRGVHAGDQMPKTFGLSYRTMIGNDTEGDQAGYKINVLYNVMATPSDRTYASLTIDPTLLEFEWELTATPQEYPGIRPTAHIVVDSRYADPWMLEDLEAILYGDGYSNPTLPPMPEFVSFLDDWFRVGLTINDDGTWTAESKRDGFISVSFTGTFEIKDVNAVYITEAIWEMDETKDVTDIVLIRIIDHGDETWTASVTSDALLVDKGDGEVDILNATVEYISEDEYIISDTLS